MKKNPRQQQMDLFHKKAKNLDHLLAHWDIFFEILDVGFAVLVLPIYEQ